MAPSTEDMLSMHRNWFAGLWVSRLDRVLSRCESPLEQLLLVNMLTLPYVELYPRYHGMPDQPFASDGDAMFYLQYPITLDGQTNRLDFAVIWEQTKINVEVDGHDFHERTKEQARRDKSRDRRLTQAGWKVLRFAGSEVWKEAYSCADQMFHILYPKPAGFE